jgi:membrane protein DedA with SNARE-associated domain
LASTAGTLVPYTLARRFGPKVAHRLARWVDVDPAQVDRWTERIHRHGFIAVVIGRLVPARRMRW